MKRIFLKDSFIMENSDKNKILLSFKPCIKTHVGGTIVMYIQNPISNKTYKALSFLIPKVVKRSVFSAHSFRKNRQVRVGLHEKSTVSIWEEII